ncbi:uncharacterized protein LAESUDRAFT_760062 [Laetiporus sulphureus 93-53]|uniref:Transmembrane protein n=1 Tax=Laetiporus sulphureus 93-53 TaxID=1314785 RepID=A0A165DRW5_9APHY|nr:uncharacterized protein LAESUDRAFT_760062 [Laetiporus sulphureus 93-53]KZT05504.1 hypothetical protein LAESUDRAFT_760062 [Laetiporus sulphureus 93-53]
MLHSILDEQVSVQDPESSVVAEAITHPNFRVVSIFVLGWVFQYSTYHITRSALLREFFRRVSRLLRLNGHPQVASDVEASVNNDQAPRQATGVNVSITQQEANDSAFVFVLNLCFIFASSANFCSLLDMGTTHSGAIACTFVIAWGSMASHSIRIAGLLMLSWQLKRFGVKRWESYAFWLGLFAALGLVFGLNATGTGTTQYRTVGSTGTSICYRQYFFPLSLSLSATLIVLELYAVIRMVSMGHILSSRLHMRFRDRLNIHVARGASLLVLDIFTIVPSAKWVNTLAEFVPFSLGALLVIACFNYPNRAAFYDGNCASPDQIYVDHPVIDIKGLSEPRRTSLLSSDPFILHFLESPSSTKDPARPHENRVSRAATENIVRITAEHEEVGELPTSAPAEVTDVPLRPPPRSQKILPSQVQYAEQLEREEKAAAAVSATLPLGPIVRPPRQRPNIFVVTNKDSQPEKARDSQSTILGSDIIRVSTSARSKKRSQREPKLRSPESLAPSAFTFTSRHDSAATTRTALPSTSLSSPFTEASADGFRRDSAVSPDESTRGYPWRMWSGLSNTSARTATREEAGSSPIHLPTPSSARVRSKRFTFGQLPPSSTKRSKTSSSSSQRGDIVAVPPPTVSRPVSSGRRFGPSLPYTPYPASPRVYPHSLSVSPGVGRSATMPGARPRPPPITIPPPPRMALCQPTDTPSSPMLQE